MQNNNNQSQSTKTIVIWNRQQLILKILNASKNVLYTILTNSLLLELIPFSTIIGRKRKNKELIDIEYKVIINGEQDESIKKQIQILKYCVLAYDKQTIQYLGLVGENGLLNYHSKIILTENLAISSQHDMSEQFFDRDLSQNQIQQNNSEKNQSKDSNQDTDQLQKSFVVPLLSDHKEIQEYMLYVTKMQKEVENLYRNNMFYEIAWKDKQTEIIMNRICLNFGDYDAVIQKRKYMQFIFKKDKNDLFFKNKYNSINKELFIPNYKKQIDNKIISYYIISRQPFLPVQHQICKLFVLPNDSQIVDFLQQDPWIIIAANNYVLFLHNYKSMDYFKHQNSLEPSKVVKHHQNKSIVIIVDKRSSLFFYSLKQKSVNLEAIYYVPFLIPYSFLQMKQQIILGGIDYYQYNGVINKKKIQNKRFLYLINLQSKKDSKTKNKNLVYQKKLQIAVINQKQNKIPILNLQNTSQKQILGCTWKNQFYLVSIQGFKLIQVELKANINKIIQIPFLFNRLNFMLLINNGEVIRVGIQSYGQCLGAELCKINTELANDFSFYYGQKSRFQLLICRNNTIQKVSYLNEQNRSILKQVTGNIIKIVCNKVGISYLLDLQHSIEVKYIQF